MTWTKPFKIVQMVLASIALLLTAYGAVAFMVHPGYAVTWFGFAWTLVFSVLRVFNRRHDTKNWRTMSMGFDITNAVAWLVATALLAKDSSWLADAQHGNVAKSDPRSQYVYTGYGLAALYCTYAAAAVAGIIAISFLATGGEGVRGWKAPLKRFDRGDQKNIEYNPLHQYEVPKHWSAEPLNVREV